MCGFHGARRDNCTAREPESRNAVELSKKLNNDKEYDQLKQIRYGNCLI